MRLIDRVRTYPSSKPLGGMLLLAALLSSATSEHASAQLSAPPGSARPDTLQPTFITTSLDPADSSRLVIPRLSPGVAVDGRLPRAVWDSIPTFPMTQHSPDNGDPPSEHTEIRMAHDGRYVYFSARMYDRDPDGIQAPSLKRNAIPHTNDFFGILLDSFLDRETAHAFYTNPVGLRTDLMTLNDASGSGSFNYDWNAFWEVQPLRTEEGWFTEVRIPFSSLRFQFDERADAGVEGEVMGAGGQVAPPGDEVTMGLIVYRRIARKNEWITFPAIPQNWGSVSHFKPSNARAVVFQGVEASRLLLFTPYMLAGGDRRHAPPGTGPGDAWGEPERQHALETGLDVKVGLTSNLTMDLTLNPDFAQVEADDQQVNLTRFSLFFPEKRLFFQERSSTFDFQTGQNDRLFYSRRIGLQGGAPVGLYGGARVAGRVGAWDVGALTVQSESPTGGGVGVNHGVVRARRTVWNANSYLGGMLTTQVEDGRRNLAYGLDGQMRLSGTDYLTLQWAQTFDSRDVDAAPDDEGLLDGGMARARLERRSNRGLLFDLNAKWVGLDHNPALGFLRQRDYLRVGDRVGWGWTPGPGARFTAQTLEVKGSALRRNRDGVMETVSAGPSWSLTTPVGFRFSMDASYEREDLARPFSLPGGNLVPAGVHDFQRVGLRFSTPGGFLRGVSVNAEGGSFYHGNSAGFSIAPRANLGGHFEVGGRYQYDRVRFPQGPGLDAHVVRLRLDHQLSVRTSWAGFVQYNSAVDAVAANVRFRYNPREGNDIYLVYNAGLNTLHYDDPRVPLVPEQTFLVKASFTVGPGL
ncbi:MAG: DUF5916 domain-containing protein [Gemmatimonadota bacterium]